MAKKNIAASQSQQLIVSPQALNTFSEIQVLGTVPDTQTEDDFAGGFTPDYTLTPLVLVPVCSVTNPMATAVEPDNVNASLTNAGWYELAYDTATKTWKRGAKITTGAGYELPTPDPANGILNGTLKVKKNSSVDSPIRLEFEAQYVDARSGMTYKFLMQRTISVSVSHDSIPVLSVDCPEAMPWNPLREGDTQTVTATVTQGRKTVTKGVTYKWYHVDDNGGMAEATADSVAFADVVSGIGTAALTINRNLMGERQKYACKAVVGGKETNVVTFVILRRLGDVKASVQRVSPIVTAGGNVRSIHPKCVVSDAQGRIDNPWGVLSPSIFVRRKGQTAWSEPDPGNPEPTVEWSDGMEYYFALYDRGPMALVVEDAMAATPVYVQEGGAFVYARIND